MPNKSVSSLPLIEWTEEDSLPKDEKRTILITGHSALKIATPFLENINITETILIENSRKNYVDNLNLPNKTAQVCYLVGSGQTIDIGRYLANKWELEAVAVPTIISTDAFLVDCTGLRENGCVKYVKSKKADKVILNWNLLKQAPWKLNLNGCGDILSIFTGLFDWHYADDNYDKDVAIMAQGILDGLLSQTKLVKEKTKKGLEVIVNSLAMEVQLCNLYGNSRPEEGGEHFFTYCVENKMGHFLHGEMVGFGILLTGFLQGQDITKVKKFMDDIGMSYIPQGITQEIVRNTLKELPDYVKTNKLLYSIYNDFDYQKNGAKISQFFKLINL